MLPVFRVKKYESEGGMKVLVISDRPITWEMSIQSSCSEEILQRISSE